jgi:hypothetical protein
MSARPPARWFERSVRAVERSGGALDTRAVVGAMWRDISCPRGRFRTTRGRRGSLIPHRKKLSLSTPCRFGRRTKGTIMAKKKKTKHQGKKKSSGTSRRRKKKDGRPVAVKLSVAVKKMLGLRDEGVPDGL